VVAKRIRGQAGAEPEMAERTFGLHEQVGVGRLGGLQARCRTGASGVVDRTRIEGHAAPLDRMACLPCADEAGCARTGIAAGH